MILVTGMVVFALVMITNIQYAMEDYGMSENSLHAEMLLQISNSDGGSSGCYQKMKRCDGEMTVYNCSTSTLTQDVGNSTQTAILVYSIDFAKF